MSVFSRAWGWFKSMFIQADINGIFGVEPIRSTKMEDALKLWHNIAYGRPPWLNSDDGVETYNVASLIADTRARLVTLDIDMAFSGGPRAEYLQGIADDLLKRLPDRMSDAARLGGMMIKYNGAGWDFILPTDFAVTRVDVSNQITGAVFAEHILYDGNRYTRLEYHHFEGGRYIVENRAFRNKHTDSSGYDYTLGTEVKLADIEEWADMSEHTELEGLEYPLFAYFRVPGSNLIDPLSPLGVSVFANAVTELKAADIALSRKNTEVEDSKHITFVGQTIVQNAQNRRFRLPRFVQGLGMGLNDTETSAVHEHVATLQTAARIEDINFDLSLAGVKSGFSAGMFVLNGQRGVLTATQVEADDRVTIQTIKNDRDALQAAIDQAIYGADALITLMGAAPEGEYSITYSFGDVTYSYEEDKANWRLYVSNGWMPVWRYLVKFEKMSEEEAKAIGAELQQQAQDQMAAAMEIQQGAGAGPGEEAPDE